MKQTTERRLAMLEERTAAPAGGFLVLWEEGELTYRVPPYRSDAVPLTADEVAALKANAGTVFVIRYVDDWRGDHETDDNTTT